jgi:hypothetical protein
MVALPEADFHQNLVTLPQKMSNFAVQKTK